MQSVIYIQSHGGMEQTQDEKSVYFGNVYMTVITASFQTEGSFV